MKSSKGHWFGISLALAALLGSPLEASAAAQTVAPRKSASAAPQSEDEKTLYALGVLISHNLENFQLSAAEFDQVKAGLIDGYNHRANQVDLAAAGPKTQKLQRER
jgi:FKBP-type peptidyl-prolyl cis-trans isomerase FkpA